MMDALHAAGVQAAHVLDLWRLTMGLCVVAFAAIVAAVVLALWRAPRADRDTAPDPGDPPSAPALRWRVTLASALSAAGLFVLVVASVRTDRALAALPLTDVVRVTVIGHQWWWELQYEEGDTQRMFPGANEMHIPVGKPVLVTLRADDVIHSFWLPSLGGKRDLIPGYTTVTTLRADRPGRYRGQCAEFCGLQHAWMVLEVVAESPEDFAAWSARQRESAREPATDAQRHGRDLFVRGTCAMCHAISGTDASARRAPDLTHVAGRARLAAGRLPNTDAAMAGWIRNPHQSKPGTNMPAHDDLPAADVQALVAYLRTLE